MLKKYRKEIIFYSIVLVLTVLIFTGFLYQGSYSYLNEIWNYSVVNLGMASGLKVLTASFDALKGFNSITDQIFQLSLLISSLIFMQLFLLKMVNLWIFKFLILGIAFFSLIPVMRKWMIRILILLFLLNPGLPVYIQLMKMTANQASLETGKGIESKFEDFKNSFAGSSEPAIKESLKDKISSIIQNIQDKGLTQTVSDSIKPVLEKTASGLGLILETMIRYLISIVILFLLVPFLYFLIIYGVVKKMINDLLEWKVLDTVNEKTVSK